LRLCARAYCEVGVRRHDDYDDNLDDDEFDDDEEADARMLRVEKLKLDVERATALGFTGYDIFCLTLVITGLCIVANSRTVFVAVAACGGVAALGVMWVAKVVRLIVEFMREEARR
jgi:hypothetical protein